MDEQVTGASPVRLKVLLQRNHWQTHRTFCKEYDRAAASIDRALKGTWPSKAQLYRWLSGELKSLPYPDHCRVLEKMFPGWTAEQLFERCADEVEEEPAGEDQNVSLVDAAERVASRKVGFPNEANAGNFADIAAVFTSRSEFTSTMSPYLLFDSANDIRMAGLSLNVLCQQYPDRRLGRLIGEGAVVKCLFLDPDGEHIKEREREEGHPSGRLSMLTRLNIDVLVRLRDRLTPEAQQRLQIATYDETIRFNIILIDDETGVIQPYMPDARGIDSPTFVLRRNLAKMGLFPMFEQVFASLWERRSPL